ncbi:MAG: T9SS type A sorting domain-containing protein, partial [Haliscomenobacter sp.]
TDGEDTILLLLAVDVRNAPGAVRNPFPENGAQLVPIRPRLTWAPLPGVDSFRITLSQDPSFSASDRTTRVARDTTVLLDTLRFGATYYWRIEGLNGCGAGSQAIFSFHTTPDLRLELSALPAEACQGSALSFRLFVGAGFQPPVTLEGKLENGALLPLRTVPAGSTPQPGSWTEVRIDDLSLLTKGVNTLIFSARDGQTAAQHIEKLTLVTAPDAPALLRPLPDTAFLLTQPMLSWGTGAGASAYIVEVSRSAGFEAMVQSYNTGTALQRRLSPLPAGAFFWRVKSANLCGTNLSETRMFSIHTGNISTMNTLQVAIDPNPGDGLFQVLISDPVNEFRMDLYNMAGQHLQRIETQPAQTSWRLDLSRYPEGVYVLRLQHRLASLSRRIVVQRP